MSAIDKSAMAANIRAARARNGASQGELASAIGVNVTTVSAWERGDMVPGADKVYAMASALGCTPNDLMGWQPSGAA